MRPRRVYGLPERQQNKDKEACGSCENVSWAACGEDTLDRDKEHFYVAHLNIRNRVSMVELVTLGTLTGSLVSPRETFRRAVMQGSAAIIVGHNHPSGEVEPSDEDTKVTRKLFEAGQILALRFWITLSFAPQAFSVSKTTKREH